MKGVIGFLHLAWWQKGVIVTHDVLYAAQIAKLFWNVLAVLSVTLSCNSLDYLLGINVVVLFYVI